jgi:protein-tyrosine phosphatase
VAYIHCGAGISRAPTAAAAYAIWAHGLCAADALALVRAGRPSARPNVGFVRALRAWEDRVRARADRDSVTTLK